MGRDVRLVGIVQHVRDGREDLLDAHGAVLDAAAEGLEGRALTVAFRPFVREIVVVLVVEVKRLIVPIGILDLRVGPPARGDSPAGGARIAEKGKQGFPFTIGGPAVVASGGSPGALAAGRGVSRGVGDAIHPAYAALPGV